MDVTGIILYAFYVSVTLQFWKTWLFLFLATSLDIVMWYFRLVDVRTRTNCSLSCQRNIIVTVRSAREVSSTGRVIEVRFSIYEAEALCLKCCEFTGLSPWFPVSCSTSSTRINGCDRPAFAELRIDCLNWSFEAPFTIRRELLLG